MKTSECITVILMAGTLPFFGCSKPSNPATVSPEASLKLAQRPAQAGAARNLDWAETTLDKIEKDLSDVTDADKVADTATAAIQSARARLAGLKKSAEANEPSSDDLAKATAFAREVNGLAEVALDRIGELDDKRDTFRELINENASLANTDIGKRFDETHQSLAGCLVRLMASQLDENQGATAEAEAAWNAQSLRCDQLIEEGKDEAGYLAAKEELTKSMSEAGKKVSLEPLDAAFEKVRACRRQQQESALEKQKLADQVSALNLQTQLLDEKAGKFEEAATQAREAYEEAQVKIQDSINQEGQ